MRQDQRHRSTQGTSTFLRPAAGFGAALSAMLVAPDVHATVISLDFSKASVKFGSFSILSVRAVRGAIIYAYYFNLDNAKAGRAFSGSSGFSSTGTIIGMQRTNESNQLASVPRFYSASFPAAFSGTAFIGWQARVGRVGWIQVKMESEGPVTFLAAAMNTQNGPIHVGDTGATQVPEPGSGPLAALGLLALGALGVRKVRQDRRKAAAS